MESILCFIIGLLAIPTSVLAIAFATAVWKLRRKPVEPADTRDWMIVAFDTESEEGSGELLMVTLPPETGEEKAKATAINIRSQLWHQVEGLVVRLYRAEEAPVAFPDMEYRAEEEKDYDYDEEVKL